MTQVIIISDKFNLIRMYQDQNSFMLISEIFMGADIKKHQDYFEPRYSVHNFESLYLTQQSKLSENMKFDNQFDGSLDHMNDVSNILPHLEQIDEKQVIKNNEQEDKQLHQFTFSLSQFFTHSFIGSEIIEYKVNLAGQNKYEFSNSSLQHLPSSISVQKIDIGQFINEKNAWDFLDSMNSKDPTNTMMFLLYTMMFLLYKQIIQYGIDKQETQTSDKIKYGIIQEAKKQPGFIFTVLLILQQYLKSYGEEVDVIFTLKSTLKSQLSMKIVSTGIAFEKFKCSQKIQDNAHASEFQDIMKSKQQFDFFVKWYKKHIKKVYDLQIQDMEILSISKLSDKALNIEWCTHHPELIWSNKNAQNHIKVTPFFNKFYLSLEDFDGKNGNIRFGPSKYRVSFRGNWPYYPPQSCDRFSIRVLNKYDQGNDDWLKMQNSANEWASVYVGLCSKNHNPKKLNNSQLQSQPTKKEKFIHQIKNSLKLQKCLNKQEIVGEGVLCTIYMKTALDNTFQKQINGDYYCLVFQARANPNKIKVTQKEEYWMINKFSDIRPYGIILIKTSVKDKYPNPADKFQTPFCYQKFKPFIQNKFNNFDKMYFSKEDINP